MPSMPLASWPARANREAQTIPIRPGLRRGPAAELPVPRLGSMTRRAHRWALSPLAIVTSWLRSKRWLLSLAVPPPPTGLSPDRRAATGELVIYGDAYPAGASGAPGIVHRCVTLGGRPWLSTAGTAGQGRW